MGNFGSMACRLIKRLIWAVCWALPLWLVLPILDARGDTKPFPESAASVERQKTETNADPFCWGEWGYNRQRCTNTDSQHAPYDTRTWCQGMEAFDKEDFNRAYKLLLPFVENEDVEARRRIGYILWLKPLSWPDGDGVFAADKTKDVPHDITLGLKLLQESAAEGCHSAKALLSLYFYGTSIPRDKEKALRLASEAASEGVRMAFLLLSEFHLMDKDYARYYKWKHLDVLCNTKGNKGKETWEVLKRIYFDVVPEYQESIPAGEKLIEEWKKTNGGRLCPSGRIGG